MGERDGRYGLPESEPDSGGHIEQAFLHLIGGFQGAEIGRVLGLRRHQGYDLRAEVDGVQAGSIGRVRPAPARLVAAFFSWICAWSNP